MAATAFGQRMAFRIDLQHHPRPAALSRPGQQPQKLEGIAIALFVMDQQGFAGDGLPFPTRLVHRPA
ncbi:hypothetical protein D3C72_2528250 [compost metagenome]